MKIRATFCILLISMICTVFAEELFMQPSEYELLNFMNTSERGIDIFDTNWYIFNFHKNAFCKISPHTKVLLSVPKNLKYEEQYTPDNDKVFYRQCEAWVDMDVYLQTDTGIFKTYTSLGTTFPVCEEKMEIPWGWSWKIDLFERNLLVPGTFITQPIVLDEQYNLIRWKYTFEDIQVDLSIPLVHPERRNITIDIQDIPLVVNVNNLPDCQPNIRLKK